MKKALPLFLLLPFAALAVCAGSDPARTCTDAGGTVLYKVQGDSVYASSGALLGTVRNGEVRLPNGTLVAHGGDAGLLLHR